MSPVPLGARPVYYPVVTSQQPRGRRARIQLPRDLVVAFRQGVEAGGTPGSTLIYGWITQAARYAAAGQYQLVPPQSSSPPTTGEQEHIDFRMSARESSEVVALLKDAGSSQRAVAAACIEAYLAAGCSPVRMSWPRRESLLAA